ncbi:unnamed protein product [Sphagnum jensenii]|uniref:Uncharacterized protein n=1 Tax=Sphagnum jensenii TaxID=128206 RepID=A0ABP1A234_9BRYO
MLEDHKRASIRRAITSEERAFREVELVVKHAEDLLLKCMCRQSSWLEAAITLANIKEEVLDIVLDLSFWKRMLKIAIAAANMGGYRVLQYAAKAVEKDEELYETLLEERSSLQKAAEILTGMRPFVGEPKWNLHAKIEENDEFRPPLPSDCPGDLRFCITRLPIREPQAAASAGDSNAGKTRG